MTFGERLRQLREGKFSQEQLADLLHVHNNTISKWENGNQEPRAKRVAELASILGTTTAYLLGENDSPKLLNNEELATQPIYEDEPHNMLIIQEGTRKYMIPNNEEGRRLFISILKSGFSGQDAPIVSNAINGDNNSNNKLGIINN